MPDRAPYQWSPEGVETIISSKAPDHVAADILGWPVQDVVRLRQERAPAPLAPKAERDAQVLALYESGLSLNEVSRQVPRANVTTVRRILIRAGVRRRPQGKRKS